MIKVIVDGNTTIETYRSYLTWCVDTLDDDMWNAKVGTFTATNIRDGTYADDIFTFDNDEDAVAFKIKFGL